MRWSFFLCALMLVNPAAQASEEEFLSWSEVHLVSLDRPEMGRVAFTAQVREDRWRSVHTEAFGKRFSLDDEQCRQLAGFPLSSIKTTHEVGYEPLGGHTVYFRFKRSFYRNATLVEAEVIIAISRGQGLRLSGPHERIMGESKG